MTTLVCGPTLLEISALTHPHTFKKHGKRQADGGGQTFHAVSLAWTGGKGNLTGESRALDILHIDEHHMTVSFQMLLHG
jgi:hypothetical protein